jgi:hypothetical protein
LLSVNVWSICSSSFGIFGVGTGKIVSIFSVVKGKEGMTAFLRMKLDGNFCKNLEILVEFETVLFNFSSFVEIYNFFG